MLGALHKFPGARPDAEVFLEALDELQPRLYSISSSPAVDPARAIAHALPQGMIFDLSAEQYARDWAIPQFYFHVMTAYAILRAEGAALGKADYVAHMFAYLRPGTMPG